MTMVSLKEVQEAAQEALEDRLDLTGLDDNLEGVLALNELDAPSI